MYLGYLMNNIINKITFYLYEFIGESHINIMYKTVKDTVFGVCK